MLRGLKLSFCHCLVSDYNTDRNSPTPVFSLFLAHLGGGVTKNRSGEVLLRSFLSSPCGAIYLVPILIGFCRIPFLVAWSECLLFLPCRTSPEIDASIPSALIPSTLVHFTPLHSFVSNLQSPAQCKFSVLPPSRTSIPVWICLQSYVLAPILYHRRPSGKEQDTPPDINSFSSPNGRQKRTSKDEIEESRNKQNGKKSKWSDGRRAKQGPWYRSKKAVKVAALLLLE